jgi:hypothetical protein
MKNTFINSFLILFIILALGLYLAPLTKEGFTYNYFTSLKRTEGTYPVSVDKAILNDYPLIGKNEVSNDSASTIWWHFPIFSLPSFKQQTNNLRYNYNPDNGTCTRPEFCGAMYHDIDNKSNEVYPLPPVEEGPGARIGYFRSEPNMLYYSIPTNENILY